MVDASAEKIREAIDIFKGGDSKRLDHAKSLIKQVTLTPELQVELLESVAEVPDFRFSFETPRSEMATVALRAFEPRLTAIIARDFPKYDGDTAQIVMRYLYDHAPDQADSIVKNGLKVSVGNGRFRFTAQIENLLALHHDFSDLPYLDWLVALEGQGTACAYHVRMVVLSHCGKGWYDDNKRLALSHYLFTRLQKLIPEVKAAQHATPGSWMFEQQYLTLREEFCEVVDILGHAKCVEARETFDAALELTDTRVKFFALFALRQLGQSLNRQRVEEIAAYPEMRAHLVEQLRDLGEENLVPPLFRNQAALAESAMVAWLTHPAELASVPDEILFLRKEPAHDDNRSEMYFFRFRTDPPHWSSSDGWMVGWSGPFPKSGPPQTHGNYTFSEFKAWDGKVGMPVPSLKSRLLSLFGKN